MGRLGVSVARGAARRSQWAQNRPRAMQCQFGPFWRTGLLRRGDASDAGHARRPNGPFFRVFAVVTGVHGCVHRRRRLKIGPRVTKPRPRVGSRGGGEGGPPFPGHPPLPPPFSALGAGPGTRTAKNMFSCFSHLFCAFCLHLVCFCVCFWVFLMFLKCVFCVFCTFFCM